MPPCCCSRPGAGARTSACACLPLVLPSPASLQALPCKVSRTPTNRLEVSARHAHGAWVYPVMLVLCRILEDAVRSLILTNGITVVVAAGNSNVNACTIAPACVQVSRSTQLQP